ncbi:MAG: hypothetical protein COA47_17850 [Robiginitomaculum sp.]|nr:MAG: hypothetical protein COA47_17850 [Robiginitomaculum sp.]
MASYADDTTDIDNTQLLADGPYIALLNQTVGDVSETAGQVSALGNTLSVDITNGDTIVSNTQTVETSSGYAESVLNADSASWTAASNATAIANSATITTCCGSIDATSTQTVGPNQSVGANAALHVNDWALNASAAALATGNAIDLQTWFGPSLDGVITQTNEATIMSDAHIEGGIMADSAIVAATAIANTGFAGGEATTTYIFTEQLSHGSKVHARASLDSPDVEDATVATTATGNNFVIENSFGFVQADHWQDNSSQIVATTDVNVGVWNGSNTASSYAVGNTNLTSNIGSDILLDNVQVNAGIGVEATTNFTGGSAGGVGFDQQIVSAAAFGNAVTAFVCPICGGGITANNNQTNSADITATTTVNAGSGNTVVGSATAIGNSATFLTTSGH